MDYQKTLDTVAKHLLTQNAVSGIKNSNLISGFECLYRGPDGKKCAIGCLIPDELYTKDLECTIAGQLPEHVLEGIGYSGNINELKLLNSLQFIHDACPPFCWRVELVEIAKRHNLKVNF